MKNAEYDGQEKKELDQVIHQESPLKRDYILIIIGNGNDFYKISIQQCDIQYEYEPSG